MQRKRGESRALYDARAAAQARQPVLHCACGEMLRCPGCGRTLLAPDQADDVDEDVGNIDDEEDE
jgi:hypothetical protein